MRRIAGMVAIALLPAIAGDAYAASELQGLDLRLNPGDVRPAAPPPYRSVAKAEPEAQPETDSVAMLDQGPITRAPNRRKAGTTSLESLTGDEDLLKELLENKTIPLFRLTVEAPLP
ncbi:MAG: hypothetical protein U1E52_07205 [Geminicoccaceae bacterium]